jgi:hypothetical protein
MRVRISSLTLGRPPLVFVLRRSDIRQPAAKSGTGKYRRSSAYDHGALKYGQVMRAEKGCSGCGTGKRG